MASVAPILGRGRFLRVNISEKISGTPLYDRIWAWKADQNNPSGVATLVKFFFQLARELDDGKIKKVVFDRSNNTAQRHHLSFSGPAAGAQRSYRRRSGTRAKESMDLVGDEQGAVGAVELVARANSQVVCGVFHAGMEEKTANAFVEETIAQFCKEFSSLLKDLHPKFSNASKNKEESAVDLSYIPQFADFTDVLEKLRVRFSQIADAEAIAATSGHAVTVGSIDAQPSTNKLAVDSTVEHESLLSGADDASSARREQKLGSSV